MVFSSIQLGFIFVYVMLTWDNRVVVDLCLDDQNKVCFDAIE